MREEGANEAIRSHVYIEPSGKLDSADDGAAMVWEPIRGGGHQHHYIFVDDSLWIYRTVWMGIYYGAHFGVFFLL